MIISTVISFLQDKDYRELIYATIILIIIGTTFYHNVEGWSALDSLYFFIMLLTTTGLGDLAPVTQEGRIFTIFYIIFGVVLILTFINCVHSHYNIIIQKKKDDLEKRIF